MLVHYNLDYSYSRYRSLILLRAHLAGSLPSAGTNCVDARTIPDNPDRVGNCPSKGRYIK
jgi:hypothetical protein